MELPFSNPRTVAVIEDYPIGGRARGRCTFKVEHNPTHGYRVSRVTTGKPKMSTYAGRTVIVDGSNGKTYILRRTRNFIAVDRSDFKSQFTAFADHPHFAALNNLIDQCYQNE